MTPDLSTWLTEHVPLPSPIVPRHEVPPTTNTVCAGCEVTRINILAGNYCGDCRRAILCATGEVVR